ncbi:unnamed protein product [Rotaria sp. Silwood2]|nr:unnamed protein product [Rotaria sp. Silwood2]CAF2791691.1 unnamed protein product [Rotaria sp. Silwood2]CAF2995694.1 unnamed protein product [Rotaria sp. Silwood2]CAF3219520.1 unnamed protein product [Rotaria sp. Silwood2]CAF4125510.1 unnamed protein product [Rotaria sp. Silwood2]
MVNNEETDPMQTDTQNCSIPTVNNEVSTEQPPSSIDTQNNLVSDNPFIIQPPMAHSTLTDENVVSGEKDLRLYISPSTSLLETTNDDAQPNPSNVSTTEIEEKNKLTELDNKPKDEPMDTSDAQASLGSDGIIDSQPTSALIIESTSVTEKSTKVESPNQSKTIISPASKALYALSQPATNKFESILAKLTASPARHTTSAYGNENESNITTREEEELFIKESISKVVRRYAVKIDQNGRTISRELLNERTVEENTTTRIESWPPQEKKNRRSITKTHRPTETTRKKPTKSNVPKRKTKSLKPTSNAISPKPSKPAQSDDDEVSKTNTNEDSTDDDNNDDDDDDDVDDAPTDDISGDEFIPTSKSSTGRSLKKGLRVFAKWVDGHFYPGVIGNSNGEKYMIDFDDGAKRHVKANDIICQSYLEADQNVLAQTQDGYFDSGIIKRLIKKKKTGKLGYIVEKDGKEKWYPLRFVSLTHEQAEHLPIVNHNTEASTNIVQGKRKRTLTVPQSPNKKTKSSIFPSPNKSQRTTHTPTRLTKLFNTMHFLLTGFNDSMDIRHKVEDAIETHGGKVIEKMPTANRRENVYLISDTARKTAKFLDAKKLNIPCVNYKWIHESIEKGEIQDWNIHKLVVPEKETKTNNDDIDDHQED